VPEEVVREALEGAIRRIRGHQPPVAEIQEIPADKLEKYVRELEGTLMSVALDKDFNELWRKPVSELAQQMSEARDYRFVVFDGVVTQRLIDIAGSNPGEIYLIGARLGENLSLKPNVKVLTMDKIRAG
jgi:DNA primase